MQKILVIIPTYNEQANILELIKRINLLQLDLDILIVDDGTDNTERLVRKKIKKYSNLFLIKRKKKSGRGTAVLEGLKFGLKKDYDFFVEMDADFSHQPEELPGLLKLAKDNTIVIGSRYIKGSKIINWSLKRKIFSKFANLYAGFILGIGIKDYTNGFRVYSRDAIEKLEFEKIKSRGYIVLSEIAYQLFRKGVNFVENKSIFINRKRGNSNFSLKEIKESFVSVLRIKKREKFNPKIIKKHYLIIIIAFIAGSLTCFPQILATKKVENFQGIYKTVNNDEHYYLSRAKDIIDGHTFLANSQLYEYKDSYPVEVWLPEYLLAKPLALLRIDLHTGYLFYDFVLPFILVILTYSIIYLLTGSILASILGTTYLHLNLFVYNFNRNPSPQFNFIFWLLLYLIWLKFIKKSKMIFTLTLGVSFGLLFHIYTYYWTFYVVFFTVFLFLNFILKKEYIKNKLMEFEEYSLPYKKYFLAFSIAFVISIPYFIFMIKGMSLPYYNETLTRIGMIDTHFPTGRKIVMWGIIVLTLIYVSYKKRIIKIEPKSTLLISGILASTISVNQHVITGKNLQFSIHYWMLSVFCFVFAVSYILVLWLPKIKYRYIRVGIVVIFSLFIFYRPIIYIKNVLIGEAVSYTQAEIEQQKYAPVFYWLNQNTEKDQVIFAGEKLNHLIPIYTTNNVFYGGHLYFVPTQEIQERFVLSHYWDEINQEYAIQYKFGIWGAYYQTNYDHNQSKNKIRKLFFFPEKEYIKIPQEKIDEFLNLAHDIQSKDFEQQIKKYRVDYFVWDKKNDLNWQVDKLNFLEQVYEVNDMVVYKVN